VTTQCGNQEWMTARVLPRPGQRPVGRKREGAMPRLCRKQCSDSRSDKGERPQVRYELQVQGKAGLSRLIAPKQRRCRGWWRSWPGQSSRPRPEMAVGMIRKRDGDQAQNKVNDPSMVSAFDQRRPSLLASSYAVDRPPRCPVIARRPLPELQRIEQLHLAESRGSAGTDATAGARRKTC